MSAATANISFTPGRARRLGLFVLLAALAVLASPPTAAAQTELGSEDDLTVLGKDGTAPDPDTEIKGFTVFGATQSAYPGALVGPGNVVVNGVLSVSTGAYFAGNSTFTAAGKIFVNDGSDGQVLTKNGATGALQWNNVSSMVTGDNLGNHVATTTLNMAGFGVVGVSTITLSSVTTTAAGVTISTNVFVTGKLGVGNSSPNAKLDMTGNELRLGPVSYPASYSTTNSGYLVMDKSGTAGDASIVFRDQGNARAEIGIVTDNDIHFKTVAGSYGSETFTDRLLIRGTGEIDAFGLLRSYGTSGVSRIFAGNSDGVSAGAALELSYDFDNTLARITSIERGNVYRNLLVEGNNLVFRTGAVTLAEAMRITDNGYVGIGTAAPNVPLYVVGGGASYADAFVVDTRSKGGATIVLGNDNVNGDQVAVGVNGYLKSQGGHFAVDGASVPLVLSIADSEKARVTAAGNLGVGTPSPAYRLVVSSGAGEAGNMVVISTGASDVIRMTGDGTIYANRFVGDISGASGLPAGDNLGDHTATQALNLAGHNVVNVSSLSASGNISAARYQINGSTVLAVLPGQRSLGVGTNAGLLNAANDNVFVGFEAGNSNTSGTLNSFVGSYAGAGIVSGSRNSVLGTNAGFSGPTASDNVFVGYSAGYTNSASKNSFIGSNAGLYNTTGGNNVYLGYSAGENNRTGSANVLLGYAAGYGAFTRSFSSSTVVGYLAGYSLDSGSADNIFMGFRAGYSVTTGTGNIVIGYNAQTSGAAANNEMNLGGLLYGDLAGKTIGISTRVPQGALDIVSTGTASNIYAQIWRDGGGVIVASMTSQGMLYATLPPGAGDNLGDHTATRALDMAGKAVDNVSSMTVTGAGVGASGTLLNVAGSTMTVLNNGNVGIGTAAPGYKLEVRDTGMAGFQVRPQNGYVSLMVNGVEVARMKP